MFDSLGRLIARRPRVWVLTWLLLTATMLTVTMTGAGGPGLFDRLHSGEPTVPGSESTEARDLIREHSPTGAEIAMVLLGVDMTAPDDMAHVGQAATTLHSRVLGVDGVQSIVSPFVFPDGLSDPRAAALISADGEGFLVTVTMAPDLDEHLRETAVAEVTALLDDFPARISAHASGIISSTDLITDAVISQTPRELITGAVVALPIALLIMVVAFGGLLAAGMPLAGAIASIGAGLGVLLGFSHLIELDSVVVNVVTILGLGLSLHYGLLVVSRYREELRAAHAAERAGAAEPGSARRRRRRRPGADDLIETATRRTLGSAGPAVAYSALILAISVLGLVFLRPDLLRSLGVAGVAVVLIALLTALTLVPALLVLVGRRMLKPPVLARVPGVRRVLGARAEVAPAPGVFSGVVARVQRRPLLVLVVVSALLVLLAAPLLNLQMRNSTTEMLPPDSDQRDFAQILAQNYPLAAGATVGVLVQGTDDDAAALADQVTGIDGVVEVDPARPMGAEFLDLGVRVETGDPGGPVATDVVNQIRDLRDAAPALTDFWVYGQAANQADFTAALLQGLTYAAPVVILAVLVLVFGMTGSVLVPATALVVTLLSLAAALGLTTWIFTSTGGLESSAVAIAVAIGFGLVMGKQVFLLARIKEVDRATGKNHHAVADGLPRSGRISTAAALVLIVVFGGLVAAGPLALTQAGVALALIVLIDATLVRMLVVPASMSLLAPPGQP